MDINICSIHGNSRDYSWQFMFYFILTQMTTNDPLMVTNIFLFTVIRETIHGNLCFILTQIITNDPLMSINGILYRENQRTTESDER